MNGNRKNTMTSIADGSRCVRTFDFSRTMKVQIPAQIIRARAGIATVSSHGGHWIEQRFGYACEFLVGTCYFPVVSHVSLPRGTLRKHVR